MRKTNIATVIDGQESEAHKTSFFVIKCTEEKASIIYLDRWDVAHTIDLIYRTCRGRSLTRATMDL